MITRAWGFKVYGDPQPKGSMKCVGARGQRKHVLVEDNADTAPWRDKVAGVARRVVLEVADRHQAVSVEMLFSLARPASHYGTGRNARTVKGSAPLWPVAHGTGDSDKLERLVLDALQDAGILPDDAAVCPLYADKQYHDRHPVYDGLPRDPDLLDRPGVVVRIRPRAAS